MLFDDHLCSYMEQAYHPFLPAPHRKSFGWGNWSVLLSSQDVISQGPSYISDRLRELVSENNGTAYKAAVETIADILPRITYVEPDTFDKTQHQTALDLIADVISTQCPGKVYADPADTTTWNTYWAPGTACPSLNKKERLEQWSVGRRWERALHEQCKARPDSNPLPFCSATRSQSFAEFIRAEPVFLDVLQQSGKYMMYKRAFEKGADILSVIKRWKTKDAGRREAKKAQLERRARQYEKLSRRARTDGCVDVAGWKDGDGTSCESYERSGYCVDGKRKAGMDWNRACSKPGGGYGPCSDAFGVTPTDACCACGGGRVGGAVQARGGRADACADTPGWKDADNTTCAMYEKAGYCVFGRPKATMDWRFACTTPGGGHGPCHDRGGVSMTDACCACGKGRGVTTPGVASPPPPPRR